MTDSNYTTLTFPGPPRTRIEMTKAGEISLAQDNRSGGVDIVLLTREMAEKLVELVMPSKTRDAA